MCGRNGTLLRGRGDDWKPLAHTHVAEDFWSVASFQNRTYVSSMQAIYELTEAGLLPVDDGAEIGSYYHLSANDQWMASIGAREILVTDGERWESIA